MIVYQHKKADTGEVFYVGIGEGRRPYHTDKRNYLWKRIYNKHGVKVEIIADDCTPEEAKQIEKYLIAYYGRICLNTGCLANLAAGGDGRAGYKLSQETKDKMSKSMKGRNKGKKWGPKSKETKKKISLKNSKLTPKQVIFVRENYIPKHPEFGQAALGRKFNVHYTTIRNIIQNKFYNHVN